VIIEMLNIKTKPVVINGKMLIFLLVIPLLFISVGSFLFLSNNRRERSKSDSFFNFAPVSAIHGMYKKEKPISNVNVVGKTKHHLLKSRAVIVGDKIYLTRFSSYSNGNKQLENGLKLLNEKKYKKAALIFENFASTNRYARFWLLKANLGRKEWDKVLASIPTVKKDFHLLRDSFVEMGVKAYLGKGDLENSLILAKILEKGSRKKAGQLYSAKIYKLKKDLNNELISMGKYLSTKGVRSSEIRLRLRLAKYWKRKNKKKLALKQLLIIWSTSPGSHWSREANKLSKKWYGKNLSKAAGCRERVKRAEVLSKSNLHKKVVLTLSSRKGCSKQDRCKFLFLKSRSFLYLKKKKKATRLVGDAVFFCEKTSLIEERVKSKYLAGKVASSRKRYKSAIRNFNRVVKEHPSHSYADDALYKIALIEEIQKKTTRAQVTFGKISKRYPKGDRVYDAIWHTVYPLLVGGKWKKAHKKLKKARNSLSSIPPLENWGRIIYWLGRTAQINGNLPVAIKYFKECIATAPVTYHSLLSLNRLEEIKKGSGKLIIKKLLSHTTPGNIPWSTLQHRLFKNDGFARFVEFSRLGLIKEAKKELLGIGVKIPIKPSKVTNRNFWKGVSYILYKTGNSYLSHIIMGRGLMEHAYSWPSGNNLVKWKTSYPDLYIKEVKTAALGVKLDYEIIMGVVREESGFNPRIRSTAGAYGLAQLMPRTAKYIAKINKLSFNGERSLRDPAKNLQLAALYFKKLKKLFNGRLVLFIGSYNAGEGAMGRWRRKRKRIPLDLFVETIQVRETRNYIKRVISSIFAYTILSGKKSYPILHTK
jgi:peptidoglycan lytic transglycosylase